MTRCRRRNAGSFFAAALVIALASAAAAQNEPVPIETRDLGGGLLMLTGRGGNLAASVGPDGTFLVDDQYAPQSEGILAALRQHGALGAQGASGLRFVLNTHWHGDHTGGNESMGRAGGLIVAHENVRARMSSEQFIQAFGRRVAPSPAGALPVVTFDASVTFHWNGHEIHVFHVPRAHTDGDAIVHFRDANLLHLGDTFFNGTYPFIDLSSGGSLDGMIAAVERSLALCDERTRIVPGHGPLGDRSALRAYHDMLRSVRERAAAAQSQGKDLASWLASRPTADLDATWGSGFMKPARFLRIVYESLASSASP